MRGAPALQLGRSAHLEEYTRTRPASASSRPRSLLSKVAASAATNAAQGADEGEPAPDNEPWELEGWGEGPSVVSGCSSVGVGGQGGRGAGSTMLRRCRACGSVIMCVRRARPLQAMRSRHPHGAVVHAIRAPCALF